MPLSREDSGKLLVQIPGWSVASDGLSIARTFNFKNYVEAMEFANSITPIAESEGHHPDLSIGWGKVTVGLSTHAIGGLSENDFIVAAKINELAS